MRDPTDQRMKQVKKLKVEMNKKKPGLTSKIESSITRIDHTTIEEVELEEESMITANKELERATGEELKTT